MPFLTQSMARVLHHVWEGLAATLGPRIDNTAFSFRRQERGPAKPYPVHSILNILGNTERILVAGSVASNKNIFGENIEELAGLFELSMSIHCQLGI